MNRKKDSQLQSTKPKIAKPKTVAVKSRIKGGPTKRLKNSLKDKAKAKPAPIVEAGYSLYSAASENSVNGDLDTCSEVLARLKERRKESIQSDTNAPFNQRLSSSTPDPEKALYHVDHRNSFQTVPERDNSGPVTKETVSSIMTIGKQAIDIPASSSGVHLPFSYYDIAANTGSVIQFGNQGNTDGFYKYTDADIHGWMRRDSDIQTYQSYIPRESTGFVTDTKTQNNESGSKDDSKGHSSSSSGAKEISQLISKQAGAQSTSINSSGTDYVVLPWPQGGAGGTILPPGTPVFQLQNGLFQIRPSNSQSQTNVKQGQNGQDKRKIPTPVQNDLGGSYLGVDAFQIPERDHGPDVHLVENKISSLGIAQDTLSTITGTNSLHQTITPVSQRTSSVNITPRTQSSVNTENSRNVDCKIENLENRFKDAEENIKEKEENLSIDQNRKTAEINSGHIRQKHNVSAHNSQGQNLSDLSDKNTESNVLNTQCSHTFTSHGQNVSGQSGGQGQIFLIQTSQGTFATSNNSSSVQLVPVSLLPSSNFNSSVAMTTNQPETMRTGGQDASQGQNTHMETMKQTEPVESSAVSKTHVNIPNPWSKVKMDAGLKKLKYLLGELKECGKIGKDVEVTRLVKDVEKTIEGIPTLSSKFNLMAEIDLCLQPLRNENCQLRRKLRLTNQQLKEKETVKEKAALDFDVLHLQASNTALQKQIAGEKETKVKLALELKDLHSQIQHMKIERNKLLAALSEKETDELKIKQECLSDTQKFRHEIEQLRQQTEGIEVKHEALEQENHILQITLQQRDAEIDKMQEVVNEVKECVALLIQELEESKTGGDKSFISNNSFSIQKLLRVLGEDSIASFSQKNLQARNPEESYSQHKQYYVSKEPSTPRLTKQALASHNKSQTKGNTCFNSENDEELKSSRSDTEVELNVENYGKERRKSTPRRGQSLSPPHKRAPLRERSAAYVNTVSTRQRNHLSPDHRISPDDEDSNYKSINRSLSPTFQKNPRVAFDFSKTSYRHDGADFQRGSEVMSNVPQSCNQSEASRYSVTDYFKKYPKNQPSGVDSSRNRFHQRSYSQPDYNARHSNVHMTPNKLQQKQSDLSPHRANDGQTRRNLNAFSPQDNLYHGTCLDNSLSAITDDNISSVSERTVSTTSTVNDMSFRRGIATLDANILKLQLALQKTKSMLS